MKTKDVLSSKAQLNTSRKTAQIDRWQLEQLRGKESVGVLLIQGKNVTRTIETEFSAESAVDSIPS